MNILLIVVDTLRADHLGCYGYHRATSPHLDEVAHSGVIFDRMIAPAIPTHPAFTTFFTGQYSITHGIVAHGAPTPVPRTAPWLPSLMQQAGYTTCAIDNLANWRHGFGRGFEFYIDPTERLALNINATNRDINRRAIPWLEDFADEKFFLFVHYWDPHTPYLPPPAYRRLFYRGDPQDPENHSLDAMDAHPLGRTWRETWFNKLGKHITDAAYIEALYDGEIRFCDEGIDQLLSALERSGRADDTCVIITADHGELMYRHGVFFDHHGLYDGNLRVPLIVRHPDFASKRIPHLVTHVDLAPTILDICGAPKPEQMEGESLVPWLAGETDAPLREFVVSQECTWQMKWSLRTNTHKFILAREEDFYRTAPRELYDLESDPGEFTNIVDRAPDLAHELEQRLEDWIADKMRQNKLEVDPLVAHGLTLGKAWQDERHRTD